jgi:ABC-type Na+ efflux pump permease subunit
MATALGRHVVAAISGVIAAIALSVVCAILLFWVGALYYALNTSFFVALALTIAASPWAYLRTKRRYPQHIKPLLTFIASMLIVLLYLCIAIAIKNPHTVIFGNTLFR